MSAFAQWLIGFFETVYTNVFNILVDIIQFCIDGPADLLLTVFSFLPSSTSLPVLPSTPAGVVYDTAMTALNWVLPMQYFYDLVKWGFAAMIAYFSVSPILRWVI